MRYWAHSCPVFHLTFLFIDVFFCAVRGPMYDVCAAWLVCSEGDRMTPQSGFYLNMFLTLNSNPLIGSKL